MSVATQHSSTLMNQQALTLSCPVGHHRTHTTHHFVKPNGTRGHRASAEDDAPVTGHALHSDIFQVETATCRKPCSREQNQGCRTTRGSAARANGHMNIEPGAQDTYMY